MILTLGKNKNKAIINKAIQIIENRGLVVLPFDTVYGIICDPSNDDAVEKIFALKKRSTNQTIGLATYSATKIAEVGEIDSYQRCIIEQNTPGKVSFILRTKEARLFSKYCVKNNTILIRIPESNLIQEIAQKCGGYLAQTSANKNGQPFCKNLEELRTQFGKELEEIDLVVDGREIKEAKPSTIIDLTTPLETIVRE